MIDIIEKTKLSRLQADMHCCALRCCQRGTMDAVQICIESCALPLMEAQQYLKHELHQVQVYTEDEFHELLKGLPMLEKQRERVDRAISEMIDDIYKTQLRRMQSEMHYCAARCCEDRRGTLDSVQVCIENCAVPLIKAQDYLAHELGQFQGRLQNCITRCNDDVRRQLSTSSNESELNKYRYQFERCTVTCVDKHIGLIPSMMKTVKTVLAKGPEGTGQA